MVTLQKYRLSTLVINFFSQWSKVYVGRDATVSITLNISSTIVNILLSAVQESGDRIADQYTACNINKNKFSISVASWQSHYFYLTIGY